MKYFISLGVSRVLDRVSFSIMVSSYTGENGGYPPTKNGDIRSLLCA